MDTEDKEVTTITTTPTIRPPPIIITGMNIKNTIKLIEDNGVQKVELRLKQVSSNSNITIKCTSLQIYKKIIKALNNHNAQYYTYTPRNRQPKTIVLKRIKGDFTTAKMKQELGELKPQNVTITKVEKITFNKNNPRCSHHLVQISNDSIMAELTKIKT